MQHLIKSVAISRLSALRHRYLRALLVAGATAALRHAMAQGSPSRIWAEGLLRKKPFKLVAVALANKTARIAWAVTACGEKYREPAPMAKAA
jgi:transposase